MITIPTGNLPYEVVEKLPASGEENKIYGVPQTVEGSDFKWNQDYRWHNGEWQEVDLGCQIFGFLFNDYQEAVNEVISSLEARIEELEGGSKILFEGNNIELEERGATIGQTLSIASSITVSDGTVFNVSLTDMTIDGEPIADVSGEIAAYGLADWDWQGGELYSDVFGNGAYFAFGTKPMNAVANQVTLGFVNEGESFDARTLAIGRIKVEVIDSTLSKKGGKK